MSIIYFNDKVAIITGASSGIGRACAYSMAKKGAKVSVVDIDEQGANKTVSQIQDMGGQAIFVKADISKKGEVDTAIETTLKEYKKIDILVNSGGICQVKKIDELTEDDWDKMLAINLKGTFLMCQRVVQEMKKNGYGKIVNLSSLAGKVGGVIAGANYAVSKAGVACLTKSIAKTVASHGININTVSPGFINTEMIKNFGCDPKSIPLGRFGEPEEIAEVVMFLCSESAAYITGANIDVNGGVFMG